MSVCRQRCRYSDATGAGCWARLLVQNIGWGYSATISWYLIGAFTRGMDCEIPPTPQPSPSATKTTLFCSSISMRLTVARSHVLLPHHLTRA